MCEVCSHDEPWKSLRQQVRGGAGTLDEITRYRDHHNDFMTRRFLDRLPAQPAGEPPPPGVYVHLSDRDAPVKGKDKGKERSR